MGGRGHQGLNPVSATIHYTVVFGDMIHVYAFTLQYMSLNVMYWSNDAKLRPKAQLWPRLDKKVAFYFTESQINSDQHVTTEGSTPVHICTEL